MTVLKSHYTPCTQFFIDPNPNLHPSRCTINLDLLFVIPNKLIFVLVLRSCNGIFFGALLTHVIDLVFVCTAYALFNLRFFESIDNSFNEILNLERDQFGNSRQLTLTYMLALNSMWSRKARGS